MNLNSIDSSQSTFSRSTTKASFNTEISFKWSLEKERTPIRKRDWRSLEASCFWIEIEEEILTKLLRFLINIKRIEIFMYVFILNLSHNFNKSKSNIFCQKFIKLMRSKFDSSISFWDFFGQIFLLLVSFPILCFKYKQTTTF